MNTNIKTTFEDETTVTQRSYCPTEWIDLKYEMEREREYKPSLK